MVSCVLEYINKRLLDFFLTLFSIENPYKSVYYSCLVGTVKLVLLLWCTPTFVCTHNLMHEHGVHTRVYTEPVHTAVVAYAYSIGTAVLFSIHK